MAKEGIGMKVDNRIFDEYFLPIADKFKRNDTDIQEIVIHGTGGGQSAQAILDWMYSGEREDEYRRGIGLFHLEIDLTGEVFSVIPALYWCYHSSSGKHDKETIGIELVNPIAQNEGGYTKDQYSSLIEVIDKIILRYPIKRIVGHGYNKQTYSGSYKNCPGQAFEWSRLQQHFKLKKIQHEAYETI